MKKLAQYLQIILLLFFVVYLIFFISFNVFGSMFGMDPLTPEALVKIFLIGIILFLAAWGAQTANYSSLKSTIKKNEDEIRDLKAKIYDLEHPKAPPVSPDSVPQKNQEDPTGSIKPRQNFTDQ